MARWSNNNLHKFLQSSIGLLLCLLFSPTSLTAQGGFAKLYTNNAPISVYESCVGIAKGMNVLVATAKIDSTSGRQFVQIRKIGPGGDELLAGDPFYWNTDSFFYFFPYHCGARVNDTEYVWLLNQDGPSGRHPHLFVTDSNGHIIRQQDLYSDRCYPTDDLFFSAYAIAVDLFGSIVIGAYKNCGKPHTVELLIKLNKNLDLIWEHSFDVYHYEMGGVFNLFTDSSGYALLGGSVTAAPQHFKTFACESGIIRTDTAGNLLWSYSTPTGKRRSIIKHAAQLADGGYAFSVMEITKDRTPEAVGADWMGVYQVIKVDASGHEEWVHLLRPDTAFFGAMLDIGCSISYNDSTFLLHKYALTDNTNWLQRYDLKGHLMSQRLLLLEDTSLGRFGLPSNWLNMPDGSLFGSGAFNNLTKPAYPASMGMAIRLDSGLCMRPTLGGCMEPVSIREQDFTAEPFEIFPNPAEEVLHINTNKRLTAISIRDMQGKLLLSNINATSPVSIPVINLIPGIYLLQVQFESGFSKTTTFTKN